MKYHPHLLESCAHALHAIFFENRHADKCIEFYLRNNKKWGSRDRQFFAETLYDCVRWWSLYWHLVGREVSPHLYPILAASFWKRDMPLPEFPEFKSFSPEEFSARLRKTTDPALINAIPQWLFQRMKSELGDGAEEYLPYLNQTNKLVIRVNTQKANREDVIAALAKDDIEAKNLDGTSSGLIIDKRANVFRTESFKKGFFEVQDGSSQQVAGYLGVEPGMRVIDACAGAGGKSLHIADLLKNKGKVIALDIHQWKLDQLKLRARRNTYSNIEMKVIEGNKTIKRLSGSADRLLLDVPCTGLGVLKRNPDTKWKLTEASIAELQTLQADILQNYSVMLKTGGMMVYSTCSILPSENQNQVKYFLENNQEFQLVKQKTILPVRDGYDGFFMALIKKETQKN